MKTQATRYSKAATARILSIPAHSVVRIEEWPAVVFVVIRGKGGRFISKAAFAADFLKVRRSGATHVRIARVHNGMVSTETCDGRDVRWHTVKMVGGQAVCDCEDYAWQNAAGFKPVCKHLIRAGWELSSFRDAIAA